METPPNQNHQLSVSCANTTRTPDQDLKMITDLWGAMMALFGELWTRSFGEIPDESGQWTKTLSGISRGQIADALELVRKSGRKWPPAAPEFRALCLSTNSEKHPPMEACYSELVRYIADNRKDRHNLSPILYHTVQRNMDFYRYQKIEKDYDRVREFEMAFKATLFQLECGESLLRAPAPETLIESDKHENKITPEVIEKTQDIRSSILAMLDDKQDEKPLTPAEIADNERLERLK